MTRMCIDPDRYQPDEYWRSLGIKTLEEVRHESLWRAANDNISPEHIERCADCFDLYHSFRRLKAIAVPEIDDGQIVFAHCPDAATIAAYQIGEAGEELSDAVSAHLKQCAPCREDVAFLARSQEPRDRLLSLRSRAALMAVAAAALVAALIPWHNKTTEEAKVDLKPSSKWASLVEMPGIDRAELLQESPDSHHSRLEQVLEAYEKSDYVTAEKYAGVMTSVVEDPSAEYLLAMSRYKQNKVAEGYQAMLIAEKLRPFSAKRCWATLQYALLMDDRGIVKREAQHVGDEPEYTPKCREILARLSAASSA